MPRVRKTVKVHESTVKKIAVEGARPQRKAGRVSKRRTHPVTIFQILVWPHSVDERIVQYAIDHKIDPENIEIVSPTEIIIHNKLEED
jgi:hypothetical protein